MAYNKFIKKDGTVMLDLTGDTITPDALRKGFTAHDKYGEPVKGTGRPIIDVEELPTVGEKGVIYRLEKKDLVGLTLKNEEGEVVPDQYGLLIYALGGVTIPDEFYNYVKEADTENFIQDFIYYVESEDAIYTYDKEDGWQVIPRGEGGFNGTITSPDQITADSLPGIYAWIESEYEYYEYVTESFKVVCFASDTFVHLDTIFPIVSVQTRPSENIISTTVVYYIEDENVFLSHDSETNEWKTFDITEGEDINIIDDISKVTEDGYYIVRSGNFVKYQQPVRTQTITESGVYDVEDTKAVSVSCGQINGVWKLYDSSMGTYDTVNVNFTIIHEGAVVNCIGMRCVSSWGSGDKLYYIREDGSELEAYSLGFDYGVTDTVDFGKELQSVPKTFQDFVAKGTAVYDTFIEVDELPEVAKPGAVYKCQGKYYEYHDGEFKDIILGFNGSGNSWMDQMSASGAVFHLYYVATRPTENILESNPDFHCYYVKDEDDILIYYANEAVEGATPEWASLATLVSQTNQGAISDISETTDLGLYALCTSAGWSEYALLNGTLNITENGEHDASTYEKVNVDVPNKTICGAWNIQALSNISAGDLPKESSLLSAICCCSTIKTLNLLRCSRKSKSPSFLCPKRWLYPTTSVSIPMRAISFSINSCGEV